MYEVDLSIENNQPLHEKWSAQVSINKQKLSNQKGHIEAHKIRHNFTNYDELINSIELDNVSAIEKSRQIAIIKYECTSKALQFRNGALKDQYIEAEKLILRLQEKVEKFDGIFGAIRKLLNGNAEEINRLNAIIDQKELEIISFKQAFENKKNEDDYIKQINKLKKDFEKERQRRILLGKNNQRLSGKASHYKRIKSELDNFRDLYGSKKAEETPLFKEIEKLKRELMNRDRLLSEYKVLKVNLSQKIKDLQIQLSNKS